MKVLIILLVANVVCIAQSYPRWFLDPVELNCGMTACGYAQDYFHKGSSDSVAFLSACQKLTREHYVKIEGGEAYWSTEAGVYWMGNNITETIDSSFLNNAITVSKRLCESSLKEMTIVLISEDSCDIPGTMQAVVKCPRDRPEWVDSPPQGNDYIYAEGIAPQYFYESSSWESAERKARFNLARDMKVTVQSLTKLDNTSGQDIRNEEVSAELRNVEVVQRWRDVLHGLYYVLVRMRLK